MPLTRRVLILAFLLIPANAWWLTQVEYVRYSDNATTQALFFNATTLLLALMGINRLLRLVRPAWRLSRSEMVALYVTVAVASNLAGHDVLQILFTTLTYVFKHAGPENGWSTTIIPFIPRHLVTGDSEAIKALYAGHSTLYRWDHLRPWIRPLGWWTLFTLLLVWTMLCLSAIFRKQWDHERLSYPIAEIPIQILTRGEAFFKAPVFWAGCAVGASGQLMNLLHNLFPAIPGLPIGVQYYQLQGYPWESAGSIPICFFPFAYGLTFLLPTQLGFSVWFFFLFSRIELIGAAMMGYTEWGKFPYVQQQGTGAVFGLFVTIAWAARAHLGHVWRAAMGREPADDDDEPLPYRTALWGLAVGLAAMVWFAIAAGMQAHTAVLYLGFLMAIVVVVARIRAELGLPTYELYQVGADQVLQRIAGTSAWTRGDLVGMTLFFWLSRTHRQFPMQTQIDALRLGRRTDTALRPLALLILGASAFGIVAAFWAFLDSTYSIGYESARFRGPAIWAFGADPWNRLSSWISSPQNPDPGTVGAYVVGIGFTLFLAMMRARFLWWPFHPVGYLVSGSFGLFRLWLPIFGSWAIKVLVLRYGGLHGYRRVLPFFIGLVLGEFTAGFVRTILDLVFGLYLPPESGIGGL